MTTALPKSQRIRDSIAPFRSSLVEATIPSFAAARREALR